LSGPAILITCAVRFFSTFAGWWRSRHRGDRSAGTATPRPTSSTAGPARVWTRRSTA